MGVPDTELPNFDHYDPAYAADPFPALAELRSRCPVAHSDAHEGFYLATTYEVIRQLTEDTTTFSSRYTSVPKDIGFGDFCAPPVNLDPPEHTRSKKLLASQFTQKKIQRFLDPIQERTVELIDDLLKQGSRFDLYVDFARLVPTIVVCELLGCPEKLEDFVNWVERLLEQAATNIDDARQAALEMFTFITEVVNQRKAQPGDDIISTLLAAEVDGEKLDDGEIILTAVILVLAGVDTTASTLGSALLHLATHPDEQQRLRENPELLNQAREEFLRAFAPVSPARIVRQETELGGQTLQPDDMILVSFPSANRDETVFEDADEVVLDRTPNRHMAFGHGIHRCLGVHVARLELTIALEEVLGRIPPFVLDDDGITWCTGQVRGPKNVRVRI